jgi:lipopolysaccharide export system permease protein
MTPYFVPQALQFAVPGTMLLATTYVYGRLSTYNEIVAIKALGISPMVLIWPTLVLATLVSFAGVYINDLAVSWGMEGARRVVVESLEDVVYGQLKMHRTFSNGGFSIIVRGVEGRKLIQPTLVIEASGDRPAVTIRAKEAELSLNSEERKLYVQSHDFEITGPLTLTDPGTYEQAISLDDLNGVNPKSRSPSNLALREIGPAIADGEHRLEEVEQSMTAQSSFALVTGDFAAIGEATWQVYERELGAARERLQRLHTEPWRRWANGFSCLCFVMVGAPMAIRLRHAEFLAIFFVCFLPILLVYYPLLAVSVDQAKDGALPPPAVWLGNIVLALWGVWLLRRVIRY